jgi:hypothetical protein
MKTVIASNPDADFFVLGENGHIVVTRLSILKESSYIEYQEYTQYNVIRDGGKWYVVPLPCGEYTMPDGWTLCIPTFSSLCFMKGMVKNLVPAVLMVSSYSKKYFIDV